MSAGPKKSPKMAKKNEVSGVLRKIHTTNRYLFLSNIKVVMVFIAFCDNDRSGKILFSENFWDKGIHLYSSCVVLASLFWILWSKSKSIIGIYGLSYLHIHFEQLFPIFCEFSFFLFWFCMRIVSINLSDSEVFCLFLSLTCVVYLCPDHQLLLENGFVLSIYYYFPYALPS